MHRNYFKCIFVLFSALTWAEGANHGQLNRKNIEDFNLAVELLDKNIDTSLFLLNKLTEAGDPNGMCLLAELYLAGRGVKQNNTKAITLLETAAKKKSTTALNCIGVLYNKGQGFEQDSKVAYDYFLKAAKMGDKVAQNNLAKAYYLGTGVKKNLLEATHWYRKSATQGYVDSQVELGKLYSKTQPEESFLWVRRAADSGHPNSQYNTALMYLMGIGTDSNPDNAYQYFLLASNQGHPDGIFQLGMMTYNGYGTIRDKERGIELVKKSKNAGSINASKKLHTLFTKEFNLLACLNRAADGDLNSMADLGWNYLKGEKISINKVESYAWFNLACESSGDKIHLWARSFVAKQLSINELILAKKRAQQIFSIYGTNPN